MVVLALLSFSQLARAADLSDYDHTDWDGIYVGGHVGYGFFHAGNASAGQSWSQDADGAIGGVFVGYNFDLVDWVLGIELDTAFGGLSNATGIAGLGTVRVVHHGQHTGRIRAGWVTDSGLLYATAGVALSDLWLTASGTRAKEFLWGGAAGAGFETKISEGLIARLEYQYAYYGQKTYQTATPVTVDFQTHSFRIGAGWHF